MKITITTDIPHHIGRAIAWWYEGREPDGEADLKDYLESYLRYLVEAQLKELNQRWIEHKARG